MTVFYGCVYFFFFFLFFILILPVNFYFIIIIITGIIIIIIIIFFFFSFFLFFYHTSCTLFPTNKPLHPQCRRLIILEYEGELYRIEVKLKIGAICGSARWTSWSHASFCMASPCAIYGMVNGSLVRAGIHGSRKACLPDLWILRMMQIISL